MDPIRDLQIGQMRGASIAHEVRAARLARKPRRTRAVRRGIARPLLALGAALLGTSVEEALQLRRRVAHP